MAEYKLKSPEGVEYKVTAPEDATEQQIYAFFSEQLSPPQATETAALPERFRGLPEMSAQPQDRIWRPEDALEMAKNIPGSAMNLARETISAASNPMETLQTFGGLVESGVEAINPFMTEQMREQSPYRPVGEAFVENIKTRYGTPRAITETIKSDPIGALADVSGLTTGVGGLARSPSLVRAGVAADPFNLAMNAPRAAMSAAIPEKLPAYLYQKSAKFPPAQVPREVREPAIETALSEKILPTYGGIDKLTGKMDVLKGRIKEIVNALDESGTTIDRKNLYSEVLGVMQEISAGADAPANMRKFSKMIADVDAMLEKGPDKLTPSWVQKFKTQTYKDINWRGKKNARTETLKALARGARKSLEDISPELSAVNKEYGPLAELRKILEQPAQRIYNRNPVSLPTAGTTTAGGVVLR
jgi:hypothetical protein